MFLIDSPAFFLMVNLKFIDVIVENFYSQSFKIELLFSTRNRRHLEVLNHHLEDDLDLLFPHLEVLSKN